MRYKAGTYDDFRRLLSDKEAYAIYFSRQVMRDTLPADPKMPAGVPLQEVITGFLIMAGENAGGDTIRYVQQLPIFNTDLSEKSVKEIKEKIDAIEQGIVNEMEKLQKQPVMYSGEIEDESRGILMALNQIAQRK